MTRFFRYALYCSIPFYISCATDPEPEDFTAEELRDLTPIMQFRGNPIPEKCYSDSSVTLYNGYEPYFRMYCYFYYEHYRELYDAIEKMGWAYDPYAGNTGDCGPKHEFTKTVGHRDLRLYVKTCEEDMFVKSDRFLFRVDYD